MDDECNLRSINIVLYFCSFGYSFKFLKKLPATDPSTQHNSILNSNAAITFTSRNTVE